MQFKSSVKQEMRGLLVLIRETIFEIMLKFPIQMSIVKPVSLDEKYMILL